MGELGVRQCSNPDISIARARTTRSATIRAEKPLRPLSCNQSLGAWGPLGRMACKRASSNGSDDIFNAADLAIFNTCPEQYVGLPDEGGNRKTRDPQGRTAQEHFHPSHSILASFFCRTYHPLLYLHLGLENQLPMFGG